MTGAINGRVATTRNPYQAIELRHPMPVGEQAAFAEAFARDVAGPLGIGVGDPGYLEAWTVGRVIWYAAWLRVMTDRAAARRAEMDGEVVPLPAGVVVARVSSRVPELPDEIGRRA